MEDLHKKLLGLAAFILSLITLARIIGAELILFLRDLGLF
jgi:hypothetical protein